MIVKGLPGLGTLTPGSFHSPASLPDVDIPDFSVSYLLASGKGCHFYSPLSLVPIEWVLLSWKKTSGACLPPFSFYTWVAKGQSRNQLGSDSSFRGLPVNKRKIKGWN